MAAQEYFRNMNAMNVRGGLDHMFCLGNHWTDLDEILLFGAESTP